MFSLLVNIPANAKWTQNGVTVAGGNGQGSATNQLYWPYGLFVDDDQTVVIAGFFNHRIVQWKNGDTTNGQVIAGGKGEGNGLHQLNYPTDVLIDKETDSLIICDWGNQRVIRWSLRSGTTQGELLIDNITCLGLAMNEQRYLYVSDIGKNEVRRYQLGEKNGTLAAGGNGAGDELNQLNSPTYLFVDRQQNVYVSDHNNHRVMKWDKGAKEGIVVAGGQGYGSALTQLSYPNGLFVDRLGALYVADHENHRVMRWTQGDKKQGTVIVGGNGSGAEANQFNFPTGLSFDRHGNLYVGEYDAKNWIESKRMVISKYASHQILNSDHCSFQQEASKSGKCTAGKHHVFLNEVLRPLVGRKFLLLLDSWKTQADLTKFRAVFPNQDSQLLIFPEGSTGYIQPQDISLFRSWRFIHEKIEHYVRINHTEMTISDRQYFIHIHSLIHDQLSAPQF
ncbi:unnamed protein product [Rotaria magnacalcarata]|uniref:DDE-1 domain-containing protein n=1 Tax=Rotaria magnacalcarata TaxID=392030 RepID=A0A8S2VN02_9BILA|nr:unnamed protein product [Rotaria magnacalcarata]